MPRTEKKFGQINAGKSGSLQTIVPSSANTKNVLLNLTSTASETINVITATGNVTIPTVSATISQVTANGNLTIASPSSVRPAFYFNNTGTKLITNDSGSTSGGTTRRMTIVPTAASLTATFLNTFQGGTFGTDGGQGFFTAANMGVVETIETAPYVTTYQNSSVYTSMIKWTPNDKAIAINPAPKNLYQGTYGGTYRPASVHVFDTNTTGTTNNGFIPAFTVSGQSYGGDIFTMATKTLQIFGTDVVIGIGDGVSAVSTGVSGSNKFWFYSFPDPATNFQGAFIGAVGVAAAPVSQHDIIANFGLVDYNSTHAVYACASATTALSDPTFYWRTSGGSTGSAITSSAAGFRIVNNSTYNADQGLAYLTGGYTYPVAPTGVTVPTSVRPVSSVKFSPSGKYLAVAYNRNYSGTGNTNSVVVIYERQSDGTWTHFASSGSSIASKPQNFDAMAWSADGSGVMVHSGTNLYVWHPGITTLLTGYSNITGDKPALYNLGIPYTGSLNITVTGSSLSPIIKTFPTVTGGHLVHVSSAGYTATTAAENDPTTSHGQRIFISTSGSASVTNYVNTPVQNLTVSANQVVQISNIVLGAGERLDMEFSTGSRLNAVAYGVEIS